MNVRYARYHSNDHETQPRVICKIYGKILCSCASLDIHLLVHGDEQPFCCFTCDITIIIIGGMHRHMKKYPHLKNDYESDSDGSSDSRGSSCRKVELYNNQSVKYEGVKRKLENKDEFKNSRTNFEGYKCPFCELDFSGVETLKIHLTKIHPDHPADQCKKTLSSHNVLNQHIDADYALGNKKFQSSIGGFKDLSVLDKIPKAAVQKDCKDNSSERIPASLDNTKDLADIQTIISMTTNGSFMQHLTKNEPTHQQDQGRIDEEEAQDMFAIAFRKMKLRGEFPCRLCTAVFPNLRALKGHNRIHLNGNYNGTYRCNMCPYFSRDRTAIVRHMRTHNGDRPFKCSLCKFAFTTKANCERHLRNKHNKNTRDEVRSSIIYHQLEDISNDDFGQLARDGDNKMDDSYTSSSDGHTTEDSTPKTSFDEELARRSDPIQLWSNQPMETNAPLCMVQKPLVQRNLNFNPHITNTSTPNKPRIHDEAFNRKQMPEYNNDQDEEPIDLSQKKVLYPEKSASEVDEQEAPEDLTIKAPEPPQQSMKDAPYQNFYNQLAMLQSFPHWPYPFLPQLLFAPLFQDPNRFKHQNPELPVSSPNPMKSDDVNPLSTTIDPTIAENISKMRSIIQQSKPEMPQSHFSNLVKTVVKNGVIMPKQKQLRYRTERPFECEQCSARFTLRSNMERHIKQQHPSFWSQRQQSNLTSRRKAVGGQRSPEDSTRNQVSDQLKYAILAQHLKVNQEQKSSDPAQKEDDEECALVIDEQNKVVIDDDHLEVKLKGLQEKSQQCKRKGEDIQDLVPVARLLDNAYKQPFKEYFKNDKDDNGQDIVIEENEDDLSPSGSEDNSVYDGNKSELENPNSACLVKETPTRSLTANCVSCPYCNRQFHWTPSLG